MIVEVPPEASGGVRVLAIRDEDPARPWDPPGPWWPGLPGVIGVRDRRAGGAWLAAAPQQGRLAVLLNRADVFSGGIPAGPNGLVSRGGLVLDAVDGTLPTRDPGTAGFNLVSVDGRTVTVTSWDGEHIARTTLEPGVHMIAHHDVNDARTPRINAWLPEFRALAGLGVDWRAQWIALLGRTAQLSAADDRAIIRDNNAHGYPTMSLLVATAEIRPGAVDLESATFTEPAQWGQPQFVRAEAEPQF